LRGSEATEAIAFNVFFFAFILSLRGSEATVAITFISFSLPFLSLRGHGSVSYGRGNRLLFPCCHCEQSEAIAFPPVIAKEMK
jgi:hypothetical protein